MKSTQNGTHSIQFLKGLTIFSTAQARRIAENINVPAGYVTNLLMIMVRNGWITRLRRGFYARTGPATGDIPIHSFAVATNLVTPSAISHWSVLQRFESTENSSTCY